MSYWKTIITPGSSLRWCWTSAENPEFSKNAFVNMFITEWIWWGGPAIVLIRTNGNLLEMISACGLFLPVRGKIGERLQLYSVHDRTGGFAVGTGFAGDSLGVMRSDL